MAAASTTSPKTAPATTHHIRYPFWFGGSASSLAACFTHPLDLIKVRLQTGNQGASRSLVAVVGSIYRNDGILGFYSGISASLVRQLTYSTVRFAIYEEVKHLAGPNPSTTLLVTAAACSGFSGGIVGNFADVLNVRMQNDAALPPAQRHNYKNVFEGLGRMVREEGAGSCFRGWRANSTRAAAQTAGQLASYDTIKRELMNWFGVKDTTGTQLSASFLAGAIAATVTNPIDVVKTKVMSGSSNQGIMDVVRELSKQDGPRWVFRGWLPSFLRIGPHTIFIFMFMELHRSAYRSLYHGDH